jgi:hypothetical protein
VSSFGFKEYGEFADGFGNGESQVAVVFAVVFFAVAVFGFAFV